MKSACTCVCVCVRASHHVHDLQQTEAKVDGQTVRVVVDRPLQGVVVLHQLLVEAPLMHTLP